MISLSDWSSRAIDQSVRDQRTDVLTYMSEPLEASLLVIGDASCTLWVSTDGPETDFTAKLVEVRPDGLSVELATGIIRTRYLNGYDSALRLEPGVPVRLTIGLGPVGVRFEARSQIGRTFPARTSRSSTGTITPGQITGRILSCGLPVR